MVYARPSQRWRRRWHMLLRPCGPPRKKMAATASRLNSAGAQPRGLHTPRDLSPAETCLPPYNSRDNVGGSRLASPPQRELARPAHSWCDFSETPTAAARPPALLPVERPRSLRIACWVWAARQSQSRLRHRPKPCFRPLSSLPP